MGRTFIAVAAATTLAACAPEPSAPAKSPPTTVEVRTEEPEARTDSPDDEAAEQKSVTTDPTRTGTMTLRITTEPAGAEVRLIYGTFDGDCSPGNPLCGGDNPLGPSPATYEAEVGEGETDPFQNMEIAVSMPGYKTKYVRGKCCEMHVVLER